MQQFDKSKGISPITQQRVRMAEVQYEVKNAELSNKRGRKHDEKSHQKHLVDRFKIEDEIFTEFGVETEHMLIHKYETEDERDPSLNSTRDTTMDE